MKAGKRTVTLCLICLVFVVLLVACVKKTEKPLVEQIDEQLAGTWISYDSDTDISKWTFYEGKYVVDFEKAAAAIDSWSALILETQATGNFEFAQKYAAENASIRPALAAEIEKVNGAGIPRDIVFDFAW